MASKSTGNGKKGPRFTKGGMPGPGRPKGSKDSVPRSVKAVCQKIMEEGGDKVEAAIYRGLAAPPPASAPYVKMVLDHGVGKPVEKVPERTGPGLTIVLSSNKDPLAEKSGRPGPAIDLTSSGPVADAEPRASDTGARAKPPAPASAKRALPPGPAAATAQALLEQAARVAKPKPKNKLPRQLQDKDGEDMVEMLEPPYLFEDPGTPPRGSPWSDSWP